MKRCSVSSLLWIFAIAFAFAMQAGFSYGQGYPALDLKHQFIDPQKLSLPPNSQQQLLTRLAAIARNCKAEAGVTPRTRAQALAIGLQLSPKNRDLLGAHLQLQRGVTPKPIEFQGDAKAIAADFFQLAKALKDGASQADQTLAVHLMDLGTQLDKQNEDALLEFELYRQDGHELAWGSVFPGAGATTGGAKPAGKAGFQKMQSQVRGLLVIDLDGKEDAGKASVMNATASANANPGPTWSDRVKFNQDVGKMMTGALKEVGKFLEVRHGGWPGGHRVEISFENRYNPKDGPSAAVACALLLDSLVSDNDVDKGFAVTGDMNADGAVQPVGGVDAKIRGATKKDCAIVAIPYQNIGSMQDLILVSGIEPFHRIQIFAIKQFEEAQALARDDRGATLAQAISTFEEVQVVLQRPNADQILRHPQVIARLQQVTKAAPHHLSAQLLLARAQGRGKKTLTLVGSLDHIGRVMAPANRALGQRRLDERGALEDDEFSQSGSGLTALRPKLDKRTHDYADALKDYLRLIRTFVNNRPSSRNGARRLISEISAQEDRVGSEWEKMMNSASVVEELSR